MGKVGKIFDRLMDSVDRSYVGPTLIGKENSIEAMAKFKSDYSELQAENKMLKIKIKELEKYIEALTEKKQLM